MSNFIISMQVRLLSLGATVHSVIYPGEEEEEARDVVLGFDKVSCSCLHASSYPCPCLSRGIPCISMPMPCPCPLLNVISFNSSLPGEIFPGVWLRRRGQSLLLGNHGQNDQQVTGQLFPDLISNNRITEGKVVIDGEIHQLSLNDFGTKFRHHVHGGKNSFDR